MRTSTMYCLLGILFAATCHPQTHPLHQLLGTLGRDSFYSVPIKDGYAIKMTGSGIGDSWQSKPLRIEVQDRVLGLRILEQGYQQLKSNGPGMFTGSGEIVDGHVRYIFEDHWTTDSGGLNLARRVTVRGNGDAGFMSAFTVQTLQPWARKDVGIFIPGMVYGDTAHLTRHALGGADVYEHMHGIVRIREDRMPAPLYGIHFSDNSSFTLLDAQPLGDSTVDDSKDFYEWNDVQPLTDGRFKFGAIGSDSSCGWGPTKPVAPTSNASGKTACSPTIGFWYPGTEGEATYGENAGGGVWRYRFHPSRDGFVQQYHLRIQLDSGLPFPAYMRTAWRDAWTTLHPEVVNLDVEAARKSILDMIQRNMLKGKDGTGLPFFIDAVRGEVLPESRTIRMGFLGRNMQIADMLLYEASKADSKQAAAMRSDAISMLDSLAKLPMSPPVGDGLWVDNGRPIRETIFLRSPSEDLVYMLSAWKREHVHGHEHPLWKKRPQEFADWLLAQEQPDGGFPRAWQPGTSKVLMDSTLGSYNAIPLLLQVHAVTGDAKYLDTAIRVGELCWQQGQQQGLFVGGTEDNPNVVDKEAGTLSLNAYLLLFEATHDNRWLDRAKSAGDYAETWIYIWNVAMPSDANETELPWKKNVPTVGLQLIATGHSGSDEYMSGEVANYAKLFRYTGDRHYFYVARVLLKDTKGMLAIPGRTYDLVGPGWQQESFSLSIPRTFVQHRVWLPWIAAAQLSGISETEEFDPELYKELER